MATRASGRARVAPVYDERALSRGGGSGGPAWAREQELAAAKENSAPAAAGRRSEGGRKPAGGAAAGDKGKPARKSAPAVAQKGRDAGLERLPIEDAKPAAKSAGVARLRSHEQTVPAAAGKQAFPGGPVVKGGAGGKAAAAKPTAPAGGGAGSGKAAAAGAAGGSKAATAAGGSKGAGSSKAAAAAAATGGSNKGKPAAKSTGSGSKSGGAMHAGAAAQQEGSNGKRKAVAPPAAEDGGKAAPKPAGKAAAASGAEAKRHKAEPPAPAAVQQQQQQQRAAPAARAAAPARGASGAAAAAAGAAAPVPAEDALAALGLQLEPAPSAGAEDLVEHFSSNFRALHNEYLKLQALYEDLKAAKIDEEVQQLLEQQNRHVTEHGQKAAQLVEHYKAEAAQHAAVAAELGGEALVEQCRSLQVDLTNCQQALLDKEVESLEKDRQLAALQARVAFLERYARVYETSDKCIQTDPPPRASASAQFPSLQSSGVEMLQAHAMVPEGAGGGSMYKRPKQGGPQVPDPSYTLPGLTPLPPGAAAAAAAAAGGRSPLAALAAAGPANSPRAAAAAPAAGLVSGSDMQLTGTDEAQPQMQHVAVQASPAQQQQQPQQRRQSLQPAQQQQAQQPRRQSLQPVVGRMAHAAAGPAVRPASAESQMHPAPAAGKQQQQRRQSAVPVPAPAAAAAAGGSRRVSAPPAPIDRELQFGSTSTVAGQQALAPLPLEAVPEDLPLEEAAEVAPAAGVAPQQAQRSPQQVLQQQQPTASQVTAAGAAGAPLVRVTLSAVPQATPASVPAPPRELALSRLTGLTSTPLKGGIYEFTDPRFGYVFQLGPASPDSADLREGREGQEEPELCYRPIAMGAAGALLPPWFHEELKFVESQRNNFFIQMMDALAHK